jgi:hypothetical protein
MSINGWVGFGIFLFITGIIQIQSEGLHVNPILSMVGYKMYEVTSERETKLVVVKGNIKTHLQPPNDEQGEPDYSSPDRYLKMAVVSAKDFVGAICLTINQVR